VLAATVTRIRDALERAGRDRHSAKIYTLLTIITDETTEKAEAKYDEYLRYASEEGALVFMSGWTGIDLSQYDLDQPIGDVQGNAIQSVIENFRESAKLDGREWTVRDIARFGAIGGLGPIFVGSGADVADHLQKLVDETDVDGFNLAYAVSPGTWEDVIEFVIPELRARGAYPEAYVEGSLREKLFGRGDRLPDEHRGASFRLGGSRSTATGSVADKAQVGV
jgi:alkanesulfonate monooxygenase SsuD/methylene tetrahydromethanopterin reductase-like flavin-dependent oxidoreductase (luciferase family)